MNSTGKRIRLLRQDLQLTQVQVLAGLEREGVDISRPRLSQIESSDDPPTGELIQALAKVLGTSSDYLLLLTDDPLPIDESRVLRDEDFEFSPEDSLVRSLLETISRLSRSDQAMLLGIAERLAAANQPRIIGGEETGE